MSLIDPTAEASETPAPPRRRVSLSELSPRIDIDNLFNADIVALEASSTITEINRWCVLHAGLGNDDLLALSAADTYRLIKEIGRQVRAALSVPK